MSSFSEQLRGLYPNSQMDADSGLWHPNTPTPDGGTSLTYLGHYEFLTVHGPDSRTFLQGQTSCDWRSLGPTQATVGSYCNIKGRMMASFLGGFLADDHVLLRLRRDIAGMTRDMLAKYIVFSKAEIDFHADQRVAMGLSGAGASPLLDQLGLGIPGGYLGQITDGESVVVQLDSAGQRFELWCPAATALDQWQWLSEHATIDSGEHWQADNIEAGLADICRATQDAYLPQMLCYHLIGGLSFKKGCYTGQEVIARMHYRGSLKKRLYRGRFASGAAVNEGDLLYSEGSQSIGQVLHRADSPEGIEILAVLTKASAAQSHEIRTEAGASGMQLLPLPYALPDEDEGGDQDSSDD